MDTAQRESVSYIVSNEILNRKGRFTIEDIINSLKDRIASMFESGKTMSNYIVSKVNLLCELGLVGRTEIYYFVD